ncbi:Zinc finger and BTB domain-containing protein 8A [Heterocephalus glaber]|uniref:Zinc finger and BTB domain-containing protein 8A n=1 Tax=Heterocephalus glaber TaxID=10181 RepID=G5C099_HETGA|nr:Zinc finger and BTB domain-containing protein 8A [Heterocephalus glaber]
MSAASFLQMTDVIGICKTFIKSSLDISEKEKDCYFSLSDKDVNSNGYQCGQGSDVPSRSFPDDLPRMQFKCPCCTHVVKRKADLKRHLHCHSGERPYTCQAHGKIFARPSK